MSIATQHIATQRICTSDDWRDTSTHVATFDKPIGTVGVKICVRLARETTEAENRYISKAIDELLNKLAATTYQQDSVVQERKAAEQAQLIACFGSAQVYVEEIPNGYVDRFGFPWLVVTTSIGRFKLGWRKRVIALSWDECPGTGTANELFPEVMDTKFDKTIHAYDYAQCAKYIRRVIESQAVIQPMTTHCLDCGCVEPPMDTVLTGEQWDRICPENGVLCASCIIKRAAKFPEFIGATMHIDTVEDYHTCIEPGGRVFAFLKALDGEVWDSNANAWVKCAV